MGLIALEDVAAASAKILRDGPLIHNKKDYFFSTESLTIPEMAVIISEVTGKTVQPSLKSPKDLLNDFSDGGKQSVDVYFLGVVTFMEQLIDGTISYVSNVHDDLPQIIGRKGMNFKEWCVLHKEELLSK